MQELDFQERLLIVERPGHGVDHGQCCADAPCCDVIGDFVAMGEQLRVEIIFARAR